MGKSDDNDNDNNNDKGTLFAAAIHDRKIRENKEKMKYLEELLSLDKLGLLEGQSLPEEYMLRNYDRNLRYKYLKGDKSYHDLYVLDTVYKDWLGFLPSALFLPGSDPRYQRASELFAEFKEDADYNYNTYNYWLKVGIEERQKRGLEQEEVEYLGSKYEFYDHT